MQVTSHQIEDVNRYYKGQVETLGKKHNKWRFHCVLNSVTWVMMSDLRSRDYSLPKLLCPWASQTILGLPCPPPAYRPDSGKNLHLCLLHWQRHSLPLGHLGSLDISLQELSSRFQQTEEGIKHGRINWNYAVWRTERNEKNLTTCGDTITYMPTYTQWGIPAGDKEQKHYEEIMKISPNLMKNNLSIQSSMKFK